MTDGLQAVGEKKQQKTVEEIDQEMKRLQEEKVALSVREHMFFPDYERGDLVALHNDIVQFALGNVAGLKLMAALLGSANSWLGHVATPCTKKTPVYGKSPDVYVYWTSRGGTYECSWRVNTAAKQVVSYTHNNVCRFVDPVKEEPPAPVPQAETVAVATIGVAPAALTVAAPAPAASAATVAEPPTVANIVAVAAAEPPVPSLFETAKERRITGLARRAADTLFNKAADADGRATEKLNESWHTAVGFGKGIEKSDTNARRDAMSLYGGAMRKRPSPWEAISHAVRRNETCVLYCKHEDDGWTDALWEAACMHLKENGVTVGWPVDRHGLCYYDLYWSPV